MSLTLEDILLLLAVLINIGIALLVYVRKSDFVVNRSFLVVVSTLVFWIFGNFLVDRVSAYGEVMFWARLLFADGALLPAAFVYFSMVFPTGFQSFAVGWHFLLFLPALFLGLFAFTPWIVEAVDITVFPVLVIKGPLYPLFVFYVLSYVILGLYLMFKEYNERIGLARLQSKYFIFGVTVLAIIALLTNLVLPFMGVSHLVRVGPLATLVFSGFTAYAIVRHRLMDIEIIIRRGVIYSFLIAVITGSYVLFVISVEQFLRSITAASVWLTAFLAAGVIAATFERLSRFAQGVALHYFPGAYDREAVLQELSGFMGTTIERDKLIQGVAERLKRMVAAVDAHILLSDTNHNHQREELIRIVSRTLVTEELKNVNVSETRSLFSSLEKSKIAVAVPLVSKGKRIGLLTVGEKSSEEPFTAEDVRMLETIAHQLTTVIENATLYERLREFNLKLRHEVEEATLKLRHQVKEIADRNKYLAILRRLDSIILNTLEFPQMAQKIVDTIAWELGYAGGMLFLLSREKGRLEFAAASESPPLKKLMQLSQSRVDDWVIPTDDRSNPCVQVLSERQAVSSERVLGALRSLVSPEAVLRWQRENRIISILVYPLSSKGRQAGVLIFFLEKKADRITPREREMLEAFVDQSGIAIENASLYSQLSTSNKELQRLNRRLTELDRMKDEFVSITSHELRTPMSAIKGYLWMLEQGRGGRLKRKQADYLGRALRGTERMLTLINDMLSVSRIEQGRLELNFEMVKIKELVESTVNDFRLKAQEKRIRLEAVLPQGTLPNVRADSLRVREVLNNLVENAIKFTEKGSVTLIALLTGRCVRLEVEDTGKGIAREDLPKLFHKFGRLDNSYVTIAEAGGTGLGLYISKALVELMGGKIGVKSKLKEGSTFYFTLPVADEGGEAKWRKKSRDKSPF